MINAYAVPPSLGGANRHHNLALALAELGHELVIVSGCYNHFLQRDSIKLNEGESWRLETIEGVDYVWMKTAPYHGNGVKRLGNMIDFSIRFYRSASHIAACIWSPDVIVGSSLHLFGAAASKLVADRLRSGFVLEIRDIWPATLTLLFGMSHWHPFVLLNGALERYLYRKSRFVVSVLPHAEEHFRETGMKPGSECFWIPNGAVCDGKEFSPQEEHSDFKIVYAGSLGNANALDDVIDALRILKAQDSIDRISVSIFGGGLERQRLESLVEKYQLTESIKFEGRIDKSRVHEVLQSADCLLLSISPSPIYKWGYSMNKLSDYLLAGRPVIAADVSMYNPVGDAQAGLNYDAGDASSLADAIDSMRTLSAFERENMGKRGYHYALCHLDIKNLATEFETVLKRALKARDEATV